MSSNTTPPQFNNLSNIPSSNQPNASENKKEVMFKKHYLISVSGITRLCLIIFQFLAWICAAAVLKPGYSQDSLPKDFVTSRIGYLFFSVVGFFLSALFFVMSILNIYKILVVGRLNWKYIFLAVDILWLIPTFVISIVAAVREKDAANTTIQAYNQGSFGAAAFFGFLCSILYCVATGAFLVSIVRKGVNVPSQYTS